MKKRVNQLFLSCLILLIAGFSQVQAQNISFFNGSLAELENQVKQSRTPYFLYFNVLDCETCTKMEKETFTYGPLVNYTANSYLAFEVDGLDFAQGIDIATRYHVKKYPTIMLFGPEGKVRERFEGFVDGPMMLTLLQKAVQPSDRGMTNRPLNTYSPPSSRGADSRLSNSNAPANNGYDDRFGDRGIANSNPFDSSPNPSYQPEPGLLSSANTGTSRSDNYDFGVDKRDYLNDYFTNRSNDHLQPKSGVDRGGSTTASTQTGSTNQGNLNASYYDDRTRPAYNTATQNGTYPYNKPQEPAMVTIQDRYANESFIDDRTRGGSNNSGNYNTRVDASSKQNTASNTGSSFLDPVDGYRDGTATQRTRGSELVYGQAVNDLENLPDGTILKRGPDGKWYIYDEARVGYQDPEQVSRGGTESSNMRTGEFTPKTVLPDNTPKTITRSVPGFAEFSPKSLTQNTFGLVVGSFVSINELQNAIKEFMAHNNARLWVYSEKLGDMHYFKLVMGEYNGEQQAVSDALRMGASWEDIEVVNLARLR